MQRDYHKPTLRRVSGKKSYYVFVTKPEALRRNPKDKQVRKSTGTSDLRIAEKLIHSIAEEIYHEFDTRLNADPFIAFVRKHWIADYAFEETISLKGQTYTDHKAIKSDLPLIITTRKTQHTSAQLQHSWQIKGQRGHGQQ